MDNVTESCTFPAQMLGPFALCSFTCCRDVDRYIDRAFNSEAYWELAIAAVISEYRSILPMDSVSAGFYRELKF